MEMGVDLSGPARTCYHPSGRLTTAIQAHDPEQGG